MTESPIRIDPVIGRSKSWLLNYGLDLGLDVLRRIGVQAPKMTIHRHHRLRERGWYRDGRVTMNLARCRPPTGVPGFSWSFPGYKADLTPVGVVTHEFGHHVDARFGFPDLSAWADEAPVSGYEPDRGEAFAEAFRLFCTNPDLLRQGRPIRWNTLVELLRDPYGDDELVDWDQVLTSRDAHERIVNAAGNWIDR